VFFNLLCIFIFMQIVFATYDPPDPPVPRNAGHFCVVALNLTLECFQFLDSLRDPNDPDAQRFFSGWLMVSSSYGEKLMMLKETSSRQNQLTTI
jgi:hypothetical protein